MKRRIRAFLRALGRAVLILILVAIVSFGLLAWAVDRLGRHDDARSADAIVVLGARVEANGQPSSDLLSRTLHALDLWQAGIAPNIICTGGFKDEPLSAASVCRRYAIDWGVPAAQVWLADGTSNTSGDALATSAVMRAHGWQTAVIVSHPLHLYRARWLFQRAGVDAVTSPTSTETERIFLPLRVWYAIREAAAIIITALREWGWLPEQWIAKLHQWTYGLS